MLHAASIGGWLQELSLAVGSCFDMDPDQAPDEALAQLDDLSGQVDAVAERCIKLQGCQQQFALPQTEFRDPTELNGYRVLSFAWPSVQHSVK